MRIEKIIKQEREKQGLTRYALAKKAGVRVNTLTALEESTNDRLEIVKKVLDNLGLELRVIEKNLLQ
ncbi:MAG: helix-turn-helix domain-containing protein [Acutalibacteraceae bacterium]